jgi:hypothetical protein
MLRLILSCALLIALVPASGAQSLVTDRPDFTESPLAVPASRVQIEFGTTFQEFDEGATSVNAPEALARIGLARGLELRVGLPEFTRDETGPGQLRVVNEQATDPSVGAKLELGEASGVALAVIAETTLPVFDGIEPEEAVQTVILTAGRDLSPRLSLGSQVSASYNETPDRLRLGATVVLGFALADQVGVFAELAASDPVGVTVDAEVLLHSGATLLLTDDLQLDAHAGLGLTDFSPAYLVGVGASARF